MVVFQNVKKEELEKLKGYSKEEPKTVYEELRLQKRGVTLILYTSGKLLLQGRPEAVEIIAQQLKNIGEKVKEEKFRKETGWMIGSDESLKGDTFGGIVVAAVRADDKIRAQLKEIGVADSKKLKDREIITIAQKVKKIAPCEIINLLPEEYNNYHGNVTKLLDKLHQDCRRDLASGKHVVDKYPGCTVGDIITEKAESKYVEVAAASVLARATALQQLGYLSKLAGFTLPKGSTHVKLALHELQDRKLDFKKFVKVSFSNVREFLE